MEKALFGRLESVEYQMLVMIAQTTVAVVVLFVTLPVAHLPQMLRWVLARMLDWIELLLAGKCKWNLL